MVVFILVSFQYFYLQLERPYLQERPGGQFRLKVVWKYSLKKILVILYLFLCFLCFCFCVFVFVFVFFLKVRFFLRLGFVYLKIFFEENPYNIVTVFILVLVFVFCFVLLGLGVGLFFCCLILFCFCLTDKLL